MNVQRCDKGRRFVNLLNPRGSIRSSRVNSWPLALTPPACMNANLPRQLSRQRLVQCRCPPPPTLHMWPSVSVCIQVSVCVRVCVTVYVTFPSDTPPTNIHTHKVCVVCVYHFVCVSVCQCVFSNVPVCFSITYVSVGQCLFFFFFLVFALFILGKVKQNSSDSHDDSDKQTDMQRNKVGGTALP